MEGTEDLSPATGQGWNLVAAGTSPVAESGDLLLMDHFRLPDPDREALARALVNVGMEAKAAARRNFTWFFAATLFATS